MLISPINPPAQRASPRTEPLQLHMLSAIVLCFSPSHAQFSLARPVGAAVLGRTYPRDALSLSRSYYHVRVLGRVAIYRGFLGCAG